MLPVIVFKMEVPVMQLNTFKFKMHPPRNAVWIIITFEYNKEQGIEVVNYLNEIVAWVLFNISSSNTFQPVICPERCQRSYGLGAIC